MIEFTAMCPDVNVPEAEYARLLGYPRGWVLEGRPRELAESARAWYAKHGRAWVWTRQADAMELTDRGVCIDCAVFTSPRLSKTLREADAHSLVLAAVSAGPEVVEESQRLWREEKPDEYFFLEIFGSAVVEHLITATGARLCDWAGQQDMAVLPHCSPGYSDWDVAEQRRLLELMSPPLPLGVLESGMLRPKKSMLAVFGLTRHTERLRRLSELTPCQTCSFGPCQYRRAPFGPAPVPYTVNVKALRRWAAERLSLERRDGVIHARFRYEGTTCTNMGRPLAFDYGVTLGAREAGYPILDQACAPAPGDTGHTRMCNYSEAMPEIALERPLAGRPLSDVFAFDRPQAAAGCYCDAPSRRHKWGLVLETIHYALSQEEKTQQEKSPR